MIYICKISFINLCISNRRCIFVQIWNQTPNLHILYYKDDYQKDRANYFYRDSSQHEVDLLRQRSFQYEAYEIKSSQTFTRDFLSGLHYLGKLLGDRLIKSAVIYAGEEQTVSTLDGIVNYRHFKI